MDDKVKGQNYGGGLSVADNVHASPVKSIPSDSEDYDMGKIQKFSSGPKGYPSQALKDSI